MTGSGNRSFAATVQGDFPYRDSEQPPGTASAPISAGHCRQTPMLGSTSFYASGHPEVACRAHVRRKFYELVQAHLTESKLSGHFGQGCDAPGQQFADSVNLRGPHLSRIAFRMPELPRWQVETTISKNLRKLRAKTKSQIRGKWLLRAGLQNYRLLAPLDPFCGARSGFTSTGKPLPCTGAWPSSSTRTSSPRIGHRGRSCECESLFAGDYRRLKVFVFRELWWSRTIWETGGN